MVGNSERAWQQMRLEEEPVLASGGNLDLTSSAWEATEEF